jgi:hypothetical protein
MTLWGIGDIGLTFQNFTDPTPSLNVMEYLKQLDQIPTKQVLLYKPESKIQTLDPQQVIHIQ